jgi:Flp pilus assembly protein TadD
MVSAPTNAEEFPKGCERWIAARVDEQARPTVATRPYHAARRALMKGDLEKAQEMTCRSVGMDPDGPGTESLIHMHFSRNDMAAATSWTEWAHLRQPSDPHIKQLLADVRNRQGRTDEARALLLDAMDVTAAENNVLRKVAAKYASSGFRVLRARDPARAERMFRRATTLDADNAHATADLAIVTLRRGQADEALGHARRAVELDPRDFQAQLVLGDAHAEAGDDERAKQAWLAAAGLNPHSPKVRERLGR